MYPRVRGFVFCAISAEVSAGELENPFEAFAHERETHVRRLKIQNYELAKRDLYVSIGQDLNPLPVTELQSEVDRKNPDKPFLGRFSPDAPDAAGLVHHKPGSILFCVQCRKQVVFEERKEKRLLEIYSNKLEGSPPPGGTRRGGRGGRSLSPGKVTRGGSNSKEGGAKPVVVK